MNGRELEHKLHFEEILFESGTQAHGKVISHNTTHLQLHFHMSKFSFLMCGPSYSTVSDAGFNSGKLFVVRTVPRR
jgi:hypothetical protein